MVPTLGRVSITPKSSTVFNPFSTSGFKCLITWLTPNRDTPGILAISSIASSFSLKLVKNQVPLIRDTVTCKQYENVKLTSKTVDTSNFPVRCLHWPLATCEESGEINYCETFLRLPFSNWSVHLIAIKSIISPMI